jgi:hypothetical protein
MQLACAGPAQGVPSANWSMTRWHAYSIVHRRDGANAARADDRRQIGRPEDAGSDDVGRKSATVGSKTARNRRRQVMVHEPPPLKSFTTLRRMPSTTSSITVPSPATSL